MATDHTEDGLTKRFPIRSNAIVALAAFWVNFWLLGILRSNAVLYKALVDVFGVNREDAAWPSGIFGFFMCVTGALSGFLTRYLSIQNLAMAGALLASASVSICSLACQMQQIIFYGALQGIGVGLIVPLTHVILNQNFSKYKAFALGIAYSGSSAGSFIFPPLTNILLSTYGLSGTFLLLGSTMLHSVMGAIFFRTPGFQWNQTDKRHSLQLCNQTFQHIDRMESKHGLQVKHDEKSQAKLYPRSDNCAPKLVHLQLSSPNKEITGTEHARAVRSCNGMPNFKMTLEILSSPYFLVVSAAYAVYFSTSAIFLMVALDFAQDRGVAVEEGVFLVSAFSIGDFAGRLSFGWIADTQCIRRNVLVRFYLLAMGFLTAFLPVCPVSCLLAACVLLGILSGSVIVNHSVLLNEYLGLERLPLAMGFSTCFVGMTAFLRPLLIGAFRDRNHSYNHLFLFIGLLQISITVVWFLGTFFQCIRQHFLVNKTLQ